MKIKSKRPDGSIRIFKVTKEGEKSPVQQQFEEQSNINNIMKKYHATGMITHLNRKQGQYADMTQVKDYATSLQTVIDAQNAFMTLDSSIRKRFQNNPQELINFLKNPKNKDEAIALGIVNKPSNANDEIKTTNAIPATDTKPKS